MAKCKALTGLAVKGLNYRHSINDSPTILCAAIHSTHMAQIFRFWAAWLP